MEKLNLLLNDQDGLRTNQEKGDSDKLDLITERNLLREDLKNVENAFCDLHKKYQRTKETMENFRKNEELLKKRDEEMLDKLGNRESKIDLLKEKVQDKLERRYAEYVNNIQEIEMENSRLREQLRKCEMKIGTLGNDSKHKQSEIDKLNILFDELILDM